MAKLIKKVLAFRKASDRDEQKRVLVQGKVVVMTSAQARRYRDLKRAEILD